ncbi:MAG: aspartate carbamoyltransferase catalytic subunit [Wenzhouxiangellaceae bacterium]
MSLHLIDIDSLDDEGIRALLDRAQALAAGAVPHRCTGTVANLFLEPSTRTRVSFELAARRLGLEVINLDADRSSTVKGESLRDTVQTLAALAVSAVVVRHHEDRAVAHLARDLPEQAPVLINAGAGRAAHPTQALLDAAVLESRGIVWPDARIALLGDLRHSRVARSDCRLFRRLGATDLRIAGPPELMPGEDELPGVRRCDSVDEAISDANVVICLRIQRERIGAAGYPDGSEFHAHWGLSLDRAARLAAGTWILHPGPVNRGVEIAPELVESPQSLILEQVRFGRHLRTAVFEQLLCDQEPERHHD